MPAPKTFLIYSVHFTSSNQELRIEAGATLLGSDDIKGWDGGKKGSALIVAKGAKAFSSPSTESRLIGSFNQSGLGGAAWKGGGLQHIAITGGGTVDGQGLVFWRGRVKNVYRPHTVRQIASRGCRHG